MRIVSEVAFEAHSGDFDRFNESENARGRHPSFHFLIYHSAAQGTGGAGRDGQPPSLSVSTNLVGCSLPSALGILSSCVSRRLRLGRSCIDRPHK